MRNALLAILMSLCLVTPAAAQVDVGIGLPGIRIGINVPVYPRLVVVPGYPVYYAPDVAADYFFYDGMYWLFQDNNWYMSSWYNGPWELAAPDVVPLFILRVPVRYYRRPPPFFRGWSSDEPPRWGEHWGGGWEQSHSGWDHWDRGSVPAPAPLPTYQRQYSGNHYPSAPQQQVLQRQNYHYQPREAVVQQRYRAQPAQSQAAPASRPSHSASQTRSSPQQNERSASRTPPAAQGQPMAHERASQKGSQENRQAVVSGPHPQAAPTASYHRKPSPTVATQHEQAPTSRAPGNPAPNAGPQPPKQAQGRQPQLAAAPRQEQAHRPQPSQVENQQPANRAAESKAPPQDKDTKNQEGH